MKRLCCYVTILFGKTYANNIFVRVVIIVLFFDMYTNIELVTLYFTIITIYCTRLQKTRRRIVSRTSSAISDTTHRTINNVFAYDYNNM